MTPFDSTDPTPCDHPAWQATDTRTTRQLKVHAQSAVLIEMAWYVAAPALEACSECPLLADCAATCRKQLNADGVAAAYLWRSGSPMDRPSGIELDAALGEMDDAPIANWHDRYERGVRDRLTVHGEWEWRRRAA